MSELVTAGQVAAGDVAVLLRAAGDLPVYERALEECGLRTLAAVGSFWGHQQVGDLLAWLRALANPLDELALYSALASPLVGISSDGLALVALQGRAEGDGAWAAIARDARDDDEDPIARDAPDDGASAVIERDACDDDEDLYSRLAPTDRERLTRFAARFAIERRAAGVHGPAELLLRALADSGYERYALSLPWGERRLANIHKLLRLARRYEAAEGGELRSFLDHIDERDALAESSEPHAPTGSEPDAVRLMTIHAAKGLEFPVVCLADLGRTGNGAPGDLLVDGTRVGLRLARLDGSPPVGCLHYEELRHERRCAEAQEEERILYVGMTRARERLLLSGAADFERWPAERPGGPPIAWLAPALLPELPALAHAREQPIAELAVGGASMRCWLNSPATVGEVLRVESLRPDSALHAVGESAGFACGPSPMPIATEPEPAPLASLTEAAPLASLTEAAPLASLTEAAPLASLTEAAPLASLTEAAPLASLTEAAPLASLTEAAPLASLTEAAPLASLTEAAPLASLTEAAPLASLSYTALSELERCGYRYYLERVLGLPEDRAAGRSEERHGDRLAARVRGVLVHRLLETLDFARPDSPGRSEVLAAARALGTGISQQECEEIVTLLSLAAASGLARRLGAAERVHREYPFAFTLGHSEQLVTGVLDLLAQESGGGWLVVDYKSDRVGESENLEELVRCEYGIQRLLYALAALRAGATQVEVVHWFLERPGEWVCASFRAEELAQLEEQLLARVVDARARGFAVSAAPHRGLCLTCPGRARLCSWDEADTLRERSVAIGGSTAPGER